MMSSVNTKMLMVKKRLGGTTGASKGKTYKPKQKLKPTMGKGTLGFKVTKKF